MAVRKALHVWIDVDLYDTLHKRREREERSLRDIVEETIVLGQATYLQSQEPSQQEDRQPDQQIVDLLLMTLREAGLARSLLEILLDYFLGAPAAQAHIEQAGRQIGDLLLTSPPSEQ